MHLKVKYMFLDKSIFLCLVSVIFSSTSAMNTHQEYYDRFKVAYIQANEDFLAKILRELKKLSIEQRDERIRALIKYASIQQDQGIHRIFVRVCSYCVEPNSHVKYETYCKCKTTLMCEACFRSLTQCPRCNDII